MYKINNQFISEEQAIADAKSFGQTLDEFISEMGGELVEGKPTDPPGTNQPEDQEKVKTDGESSSVNGSLELAGPSPTPQTTGFPGLDLAVEDATDAPISRD